ncbi:class I SAM-dependent methyltransferase [Clostridium sp.]|uniref:class I SAM-dependent DNA methyltransferase n=1 Tax=Clostridium sp. TaxID=1506 RepID=UPI0026107C20|nr:class I SAM-dependent methyltransferase [Clostridium sp.]
MTYGEFAKIYDELINEDIDYEYMCSRIIEICKEEKISFNSYLDVACGTGNVTVKIANKFKEVFAVDLSEDMLTEAYDKLEKENISCNLICQDMSDLYLNKEFDLITSVLDSTNYIVEEEQLKSYFEGIKNHLKDDGIFIFDINSYYKLSNILGNNTYTYNEEEVFYVWENLFEEDLLSMYLTFFVKKGKLYERFEEEHLEKAYKEDYIENIVKNIGFEIIGKFDGYSKENVNTLSERIMYILKK